ncbi:NADPH:quinone reductase [Lactococcus cremoris]|nr:NADPH:quinone reductase [Lactococcus cremoris]
MISDRNKGEKNMKAAILSKYGKLPVYQDFPDPVVHKADETLIYPTASAIKQLDISKAAGTHYTKFDKLPSVVGTDGVGITDAGDRIYTMGITGMMAEKAIIKKKGGIIIPKGLDDGVAAAIPNTLVGSDLALMVKGGIKSGDCVFINGATGGTGAMAVQMAKIRGAKTVIVTGRDSKKLEYLKEIGADVTIDLKQDNDKLIKAIIESYKESPFDIILDYLWGQPAEAIMTSLLKVRLGSSITYISVGSLANNTANIPSQLLRSKEIQIVGSGIGSFPASVLQKYLQENLKMVYDLVNKEDIKFKTASFNLEEVSHAWTHSPSVLLINKHNF